MLFFLGCAEFHSAMMHWWRCPRLCWLCCSLHPSCRARINTHSKRTCQLLQKLWWWKASEKVKLKFLHWQLYHQTCFPTSWGWHCRHLTVFEDLLTEFRLNSLSFFRVAHIESLDAIKTRHICTQTHIRLSLTQPIKHSCVSTYFQFSPRPPGSWKVSSLTWFFIHTSRLQNQQLDLCWTERQQQPHSDRRGDKVRGQWTALSHIKNPIQRKLCFL